MIPLLSIAFPNKNMVLIQRQIDQNAKQIIHMFQKPSHNDLVFMDEITEQALSIAKPALSTSCAAMLVSFFTLGCSGVIAIYTNIKPLDITTLLTVSDINGSLLKTGFNLCMLSTGSILISGIAKSVSENMRNQYNLPPKTHKA